jgi:ferrochelatase
MQYGEPALAPALAQLNARGAEEIFVLPFFPQFSAATHGPVRAWAAARGLPVIRPFPTDDFFIRAWARALGSVAGDETLLFSFHGLPEAQVRKLCDCLSTAGDQHGEDCYRGQCFATARAIAAELGVPGERVEIAFQSRLGRAAWLQPYAQAVVQKLAQAGKKKLRVACPSFTVDCLESLEEIQVELKKNFLDAGGERFVCVPCPNADEQWAQALAEFVQGRAGEPPLHLGRV